MGAQSGGSKWRPTREHEWAGEYGYGIYQLSDALTKQRIGARKDTICTKKAGIIGYLHWRIWKWVEALI